MAFKSFEESYSKNFQHRLKITKIPKTLPKTISSTVSLFRTVSTSTTSTRLKTQESTVSLISTILTTKKDFITETPTSLTETSKLTTTTQITRHTKILNKTNNFPDLTFLNISNIGFGTKLKLKENIEVENYF